MTQDPPTPPEPSNSDLPPSEPQPSEPQISESQPSELQTSEAPPLEPPAPPTPAKPPKPESQPLQEFWRQAQPVLKTVSVKTLRLTIRVLEGAVDKLEAEPSTPITTPSTEARSPLRSSTPPAAIADVTPAAPTPPPIPSSPSPAIFEQLRPIWRQVQQVWGFVLTKVRSQLPASFNQRLSNSALTGIAAGVLVLLLWTTSALRSGGEKPPAVAVAPPAASTPVPSVPTPSVAPPPKLVAPEPEKPIAISPTPPASEKPSPAPIATPTPVTAPTPIAPPPPLNLTPEQSLIAAIQDQVAEITDHYADGLIRSIQANFRSSRLTVKVGEDWYSLNRSRQDRLAGEMLKRAKELDFSKLEITDTTGTLLARSPVVGSEMIILQREAKQLES